MTSPRVLIREQAQNPQKQPTKSADIVSDWLGYLTHNEIAFLKKLSGNRSYVAEHGCIVNIGAGGGTSALAFLEERRDITLYSVDIDKVRFQGEETVVREANLWDDRSIIQILGKSHDVGKAWPTIPRGGRYLLVDMVFVDDGHLEPEIRGDIESWLPNILPGGVIAFHDYTDYHWPDVKLVVDELMVGKVCLGQVDTVIAFVV